MNAGCFVAQLLQFYVFILLARIILSWFTQMGGWTPPAALAPIVGFIFEITEPVLGFVRRFIPPLGPIDISPIFVFFGIQILARLICN